MENEKKLNIKINWVRTNLGWYSVEGRFRIEPVLGVGLRYQSILGYKLTDGAQIVHIRRTSVSVSLRLDGIRECKRVALRRVKKELSSEQDGPGTHHCGHRF